MNEGKNKYFWNKEIHLGKTIKIILLIVFVVFLGMLFSGDNTHTTQQNTNDGFFEQTKKVLQSQENRFGCEKGKIENLAGIDLTGVKNTYKVLGGIRTNIVRYPLNKDNVKIEYCFRVANLASDMGDLELRIRFLDKDKNVLAEDNKIIWDIPGKRIKTVYGYKLVNARLANEMTDILVGK